ncbi:MAG: FtsX-like permease family protein [Clostridia bacterium]
MNRLNKKIFRDIKLNKMQFFNIFIMVFLGVFVFTGIHAYMDGMDKSAEKYYKENNLQDIWIEGAEFSSQDLEDIKNIDNVENAERELTITANLDKINEEEKKDITLETNFIESNEISKMYVVDGEEFGKEKDGVWFDSYLANSLNLKVGDSITFSYNNENYTKKVLGLITVPDHVYFVKDSTAIFPTHTDYGFMYMSIDEFPIQMDNIYNKVIVDVEDENKIEETKSKIENDIKSAVAVTTRNESVSYNGYNSEIEEGSTYSGVFTFLFLFIAILSVTTTMNRFVKKQRTTIGTLKALGFKNRKINKHYISYGFYTSLFASILGIIVGRYSIGAFFLHTEMTYFEIPTYKTVLIPTVYILAVLVVILITIVTYLSCRNILKESAVEALRVEEPKVKNSKFDLGTRKIFKRASISTRWNIRDIMRNKGRSIMAIVGITGCTMLLVCAFGLLDTMNSYLDWEFEKISKFDYKLTLKSDYTENELDNLKQKYGNATSMTLGIEFKNGDSKQANSIVVNDAKDNLKYTNHEREYMDLNDDGIYVTEKLAEKYNLKIGDEVEWHIFGDETWYKSEIVGINRDPQSQIMNMTRKYYESLNLKYRADSLYTNENLENTKSLDGVEVIQSIETLKQGMENMLQTMKLMLVILIVVSAVLGFVIIYNLGILSLSEKQYQFATLKVLGFKNKQIKNIFVKQNIWLALIGIVLGLPLGYIMVDYIFKSALGDSYDFNAYIRIISYLYAAVGSFVVAIFVNKVLARKIKKIDMVSSLKGNE